MVAYLSTSLLTADRALAWATALRDELDVQSALDWWAPEFLRLEDCVKADREARAIEAADMLIVLLPGRLGTHVELGIALGAGQPVILVGKAAQECLFYAHPNVHQVETTDALIPFLAGWIAGGVPIRRLVDLALEQEADHG